MTRAPDLPATVAPHWRPRPDAWLQRPPSRYAGRPDRPLFIGACPRSGTTILQVMLDAHPELGVPRETGFVRELWWQRVRFGDLRDPENRRRVAEWIYTDRAVKGKRLRDGLIGRKAAIRRVAQAPPTVGSIVQAVMELYAELHGKPRWGDKRPAYSGFVEPLFAMFPDALYVNVVRDPRGAVASQALLTWDDDAVAVPAAIARWEGAILRTDHGVRRLRPDQVLDVRYEDLVRDPHGTLEHLCAFAGLRGGDAVRQMIESERRGRFKGPHERVAQPVTTASVERWRERLTPAQVALVERATAPYLERFGYRASEPGAQPLADDERELARQRRRNRREWQRTRFDEVVRRVRHRRPVAAVRPG